MLPDDEEPAMAVFEMVVGALSEAAGCGRHRSQTHNHPMDQPNSFTPRAQQVLQLARKEAERFHHNYLGTEHLLLGLIKLGGNGVAGGVIQTDVPPKTGV